MRNLKLMEAEGFIENTPTDSPRERQVGITEHGRRTIGQTLPQWKSVQRLIKKHVDPESLNALNNALTVLELLAAGGAEMAA